MLSLKYFDLGSAAIAFLECQILDAVFTERRKKIEIKKDEHYYKVGLVFRDLPIRDDEDHSWLAV